MAVGTGWRGCLPPEVACPQGLCVPDVEMLGPVKWHTVGAQDTWREPQCRHSWHPRCSEALPGCRVGRKSGLAADTCLMDPELQWSEWNLLRVDDTKCLAASLLQKSFRLQHLQFLW